MLKGDYVLAFGWSSVGAGQKLLTLGLNVISIGLCTMILPIELYLFITLCDLNIISRSKQCQTA